MIMGVESGLNKDNKDGGVCMTL